MLTSYYVILFQVGYWDPDEKIKITKSYKDRMKETNVKLNNTTLRIVTVYVSVYILI